MQESRCQRERQIKLFMTLISALATAARGYSYFRKEGRREIRQDVYITVYHPVRRHIKLFGLSHPIRRLATPHSSQFLFKLCRSMVQSLKSHSVSFFNSTLSLWYISFWISQKVMSVEPCYVQGSVELEKHLFWWEILLLCSKIHILRFLNVFPRTYGSVMM